MKCGCERKPSSLTANLAIIDQMRPSVILRLPFTISSAPIDTSLTPWLSRNFNALFTLAILCQICSPCSGLGNWSPVTCSSNNKRFRPSLKSLSIVWIWTSAFFKWKLHQAKNVLNTIGWNYRSFNQTTMKAATWICWVSQTESLWVGFCFISVR